MATSYIKRKPLSVMQQVLRMKTLHPQFKEAVKTHRAVWTGTLKPVGLSETYTVRITYDLGLSPRVSVIAPELRARAEGERIPHVYRGDYPCLYFPWNKEWTPDKLIALTVVPWASLWLYYYEVWHATGVWLGGGIEHEREDKDPQ
jgi:hypothetical protein